VKQCSILTCGQQRTIVQEPAWRLLCTLGKRGELLIGQVIFMGVPATALIRKSASITYSVSNPTCLFGTRLHQVIFITWRWVFCDETVTRGNIILNPKTYACTGAVPILQHHACAQDVKTYECRVDGTLPARDVRILRSSAIVGANFGFLRFCQWKWSSSSDWGCGDQ
jgi:hypothetical protein